MFEVKDYILALALGIALIKGVQVNNLQDDNAKLKDEIVFLLASTDANETKNTEFQNSIDRIRKTHEKDIKDRNATDINSTFYYGVRN